MPWAEIGKFTEKCFERKSVNISYYLRYGDVSFKYVY
jgi:hypothetical protein